MVRRWTVLRSRLSRPCSPTAQRWACAPTTSSPAAAASTAFHSRSRHDYVRRMTKLTVAALQLAFPDGKVAGIYRKSHIPDGPGYEEKFYFRPGNTGFKVWPGPHLSTLGVGVCWDQWYPETARAMTLMGADILFYPTAIGTEPHDPELDTSRLWRRAMIGHAVSNVVPVVAANRIGTEGGQRFYGQSFICDERGDVLAEFGAEETGALVATLDLAAAKKHRAAFGFFRDRRPELYGRLVEDL